MHTRPEHCDEAIRIADIFRAKIVDSSPGTHTIEVTEDVDKVEALINMLEPLGIKVLIRSGRIAIPRETDSRPGESSKWPRPDDQRWALRRGF